MVCFQGLITLRALPGKAPTAQLARIDTADDCSPVPLTGTTRIPECAVSSAGFLWGLAAVSRTSGFCGARHSSLTCLANRHGGTQVLQPLGAVITLQITQSYRAACQPGGNSTPADSALMRATALVSRGQRRSPCSVRPSEFRPGLPSANRAPRSPRRGTPGPP